MQTKQNRNHFIDCISFIFSLMTVAFHFGNGFCPGGRIAVEGYFMITGYLMMNSINHNHVYDAQTLGKSSVLFLWRKYNGFLPYLIPSVFVGVVVRIITNHLSVSAVLQSIPLLLFEVVPLRVLGYQGWYIIGISWYLSAMLFSLSVCYPMCKKWGENFALIFGIPSCILIYGFLCYHYGHIAVTDYEEGTIIPGGLLRGLAGILAGCVLYVAVSNVRKIRLTSAGKAVTSLTVISAVIYYLYAVYKRPMTAHDYVLVFVTFYILTIGISDVLGVMEKIPFRTGWLKNFSILLVMNHYYWVNSYDSIFETDGWNILMKFSLFSCLTLLSCAVVLSLNRINNAIIKKLRLCESFSVKDHL